MKISASVISRRVLRDRAGMTLRRLTVHVARVYCPVIVALLTGCVTHLEKKPALIVDRLPGTYRVVSSGRQVTVIITQKGLVHRPAPGLEDAMFRNNDFADGVGYYVRVGFEPLSSSDLGISPIDHSKKSYVSSTSGENAEIHSDFIRISNGWKVLLYRYEAVGRQGHPDLYAQVAFAKTLVGTNVVRIEQTLFYGNAPPDSAGDLLLSLLSNYKPKLSGSW